MLGGTDRVSSDSTVDGLSHDEPPFNSLAVPNSAGQESSSEVVVDPPPCPDYQPALKFFQVQLRSQMIETLNFLP